MYVFQMFDYYSVASFAMLWATLFESLVIGWIYGELKVLFCEGEEGGVLTFAIRFVGSCHVYPLVTIASVST